MVDHEKNIRISLEKAHLYILDRLPSQTRLDWLCDDYITWYGVDLYHASMWAATNRDFLAEWVLDWLVREGY